MRHRIYRPPLRLPKRHWSTDRLKFVLALKPDCGVYLVDGRKASLLFNDQSRYMIEVIFNACLISNCLQYLHGLDFWFLSKLCIAEGAYCRKYRRE